MPNATERGIKRVDLLPWLQSPHLSLSGSLPVKAGALGWADRTKKIGLRTVLVKQAMVVAVGQFISTLSSINK